ncbi:MAG: keto-deoxy-phosphogluconate aldolase, partial [Proteobacteria bacterium]|nr:keto-deoxy-phosphogluconate aldolase [Pseudomonadota bacterium]
MTIETVLSSTRMIPVLTINRVEDAVPLCTTLAEAGLLVLEITLRTGPALAAVVAAAKALPEATIGVGTLLDGADFARARDAGARFA